MKKALLILILMGLSNILVSCFNNCGPFPEFFSIKELSIEFGRTDGNNTFVQTAIQLPHTIAAISLNVEESALISQEINFPNLFINQLYACDPIVPRSKQKIISLEITSPNPLYFESKTVMANENVSKYFTVQNAFTIDEFIAERPTFKDNYEKIIFKLNTPPDSTINHSFNFKIVLDDGQTYDLTVEHVKIETE